MLSKLLSAMRRWLCGWNATRFDVHVLCSQGERHRQGGMPNQDAAFALVRDVDAPTCDTPASSLMLAGVFDGHGQEGQRVSKRAADAMERMVTEAFLTGMPTNVTAFLQQVFDGVHAGLVDSGLAGRSGTTASLVVVQEGHAHVAWVGDSMVVLIADGARGECAHVSFVTRMHRASDGDELARVQSCGGRVVDGYVVDKAGTHGIALTRSMGDLDMHAFGCVPVPQIVTLELHRQHSVLVMASDGLWDSSGLSADMIVRIAGRRRGRSAKRICQQLMDAVVAADGPADDCTIVCLILK